jgi:hypothetical protein
MRRLCTAFTVFLSLTLLSGCALLSGKSVQTKDVVTESAKLDPTTAPVIPSNGIEVTWEVPSEPVDGFIIRYGDSPATLAREVTISSADIREETDPEFGPVYRYLIRDAADASRLFVSIAAVKGQAVSNFSEALEARADAATDTKSYSTSNSSH